MPGKDNHEGRGSPCMEVIAKPKENVLIPREWRWVRRKHSFWLFRLIQQEAWVAGPARYSYEGALNSAYPPFCLKGKGEAPPPVRRPGKEEYG